MEAPKGGIIVTTTTIALATSTVEIDKTRTSMTIGLTNDFIKIIVTIMIVIPHFKIKETTSIIMMINLIILMIEDMPRARTKAEIATRVVIMPTILMQATGNLPAPIVLTLPTGKSKERMLIPLYKLVLIALHQVNPKNNTTSK